jgi:hypothetical protein
MRAAGAVPIACLLTSLPPPVGDQAAGGLVDDEPGVRGGEQVPVRGGGHAESRRGCLVAVVAVPLVDRVGDVVREGRGAGAVPDGADLPVPDRVVVALADGEDGAVEGGLGHSHRRRALENWCIDKDTWSGLAGRRPPVPGPQQPELGDRKRQIASIYVWTQVTSGEHYFAPRPIEAAQPPEIQEAWTLRRNTIWSLMHRSNPGPHYASLKAELGTIATSLARTTDARR